ncbi:hypothetical protein PsorP6_017825 [Peronosclerospora sorghi]|uniref:Uncharacterized protein n=1 Tax=Peronosclerospora sorghi TaxID=230839 RepID=A0ACC0WEP1_9STRA|nr:hypothetical protein PsorP6_017825 [Peronosclerospora sorghi]
MMVGARMASATGTTMGAKRAVLRNKSNRFYAASMSSIFFLLSSTYIGRAKRYQSKYVESPAIDHPTTALLVENQGPPQKLAFPSLLPKSINISVEEIERRIVIRMDELRKEMQEQVATLDSNDRVK